MRLQALLIAAGAFTLALGAVHVVLPALPKNSAEHPCLQALQAWE